MALEEKTYLLCNHTPSKIIVALRDGSSAIIEGGSNENPSTYPFTLSELQYINNSSQVLKIGQLRPAKDCEEFIYNELRIQSWKDILTNEQIEDIILNPTNKKLEKIISIKDPNYFERVYGIFIGLRNANAPITANTINVIVARYREHLAHKRDSEIVLKVTETPSNSNKEVEDLKKQLEELRALISAGATVPAEEKPSPKKTVTRKPVTKAKTTEKAE